MSDLNKFASLGKDIRIEARETLQKLFGAENAGMKDELMAHATAASSAEM